MIALAINGHDQGAAAVKFPQLLPNAAYMYIDAAVKTCKRTPQPLLGEYPLAHRAADVAGEYLQDIEFRTGEL